MVQFFQHAAGFSSAGCFVSASLSQKGGDGGNNTSFRTVNGGEPTTSNHRQFQASHPPSHPYMFTGVYPCRKYPRGLLSLTCAHNPPSTHPFHVRGPLLFLLFLWRGGVSGRQPLTIQMIKRGGVQMKCWDIGGQAQYRGEWGRYTRGCDVIVYVVDAHAEEKVGVGGRGGGREGGEIDQCSGTLEAKKPTSLKNS